MAGIVAAADVAAADVVSAADVFVAAVVAESGDSGELEY